MNEIYELKIHHDTFTQGDWKVLVEHDWYNHEVNFFLAHKDYMTYHFCFGIPMESKIEDPDKVIQYAFEHQDIYKELYFDEDQDN